MNTVQEAYEQISYPRYVHPLSNPSRVAAIGRLFGVDSADPRAARVLDIGCGSGTNLLAMAERFPASEFVGIDFAASEIAAGQAIAAEAGLQNVRLEQADLLTWEPDDEGFDYIIAYGLFSWVPDQVKDRLFEVCRRCLKPHGIACISYMTYPGCKQTEAFRDLLQLQTETCESPTQKVVAAHRVLDFLDHAYSDLPNLPHSSHLRHQVEQIRRKDSHFLLLDELGVERDPCYLLQFVNWAAEHDLRYLGESEFHMMFLENLPAQSARELAEMNLDRLHTEQLIDYVVNRSFRCSLLTQLGAGEAQLDAEALQRLSLRPHLQPVGASDDWQEGRFITQAGHEITLRSTPLATLCQTLSDRPNAYRPFDLLRRSAEAVAGRKFTDVEISRLCHDLLSLYVRRHVDLSAVPLDTNDRIPPKPCLTPLNRVLARTQAMVASVCHLGCQLAPEEQQLCGLLDGTRTSEEIRATPAGREMNGRLDQFIESLWMNGAFREADDADC